LVVEDDAPIAASLVRGLRQRGYVVELETNGSAAAQRDPQSFDAVVVDLGLPGTSGLELLAHWRTRTSAPLIVLTAQNGLEERLASFEKGAADFLPKPFFFEELAARLELRLGKTTKPKSREVTFGAVRVDLDARLVYVEEATVGLTANEFNVLAALMARPTQPLTRAQLSQAALTDGADARTVDSHVARLRKKLGKDGEAIATVWGIGYSFRP
jgi:DNA-binding response OmpR family regulator